MQATTFTKMEQCARLARQGEMDQAHEAETGLQFLLRMLEDAEWQVNYAACVALEDCADARAVPALLALLAREDAAPLYSQPEVPAGDKAGAPRGKTPQFPAGTTSAELAAWERRGRVKQAACLALCACARGEGTPIMSEVLQFLHRYAVSAQEDYTVRAAACLALGKLAQPASLDTLVRASEDEEWCTRTEATKALAAVRLAS